MFVAGYATDAEIAELEKRGWEVEDAAARGLVEPCNLSELSLADLKTDKLMTAPETPGTKAVVVFIDNDLFNVMSGLDWDLGSYPIDVVKYEELKTAAREQRQRIESYFGPGGAIQRRCSHKYPDGTDASVGVPVSGERFCKTCGAQWD